MAAILNNLHIVKNAHGLTSGTQQIWNQHLRIDKKPSKNVVYVEKQGGSSPILDYFLYFFLSLHVDKRE